MSAQEDGETNYWPGYVDALTTMTMVLTFVMMILAIGVYLLSESLSKSLLATLLRQADVEVSDNATPQEIQEKLVDTLAHANQNSARQELRESEDDNAREVFSEKDQRKPKEPGKVETSRNGSLLRVSYEDAETRLNEHSRAEIAAFTKESAALRNARFIVINAHAAPEAGGASQARRLAYYRAMILRNELISLGIEPHRLRIQVDETEDTSAGQTAEIFAK
ncbi:MAG: hypothetical protein KDJ55_11960 [Rhodobiaceae bacterium]|nr:hypothetical protein [Rhodobiaceae bacterium]MCC0012666.1 hypothetical protein [Rhodobiaceae bacterium]MCC0018027.1 hypothetical protein [Rhodobiaceae bacterium]